MDEWPELEELARAVDAWRDWPVALPVDAQRVIDAAGPVVDNYRSQKVLIEHYKNMPPISLETLRHQGLVSTEQYARQVGIPFHRTCCTSTIDQAHLASCAQSDHGQTLPTAAVAAAEAAADAALDGLGLTGYKAVMEVAGLDDQEVACPGGCGMYYRPLFSCHVCPGPPAATT
ncbi:hypothetical protein SEA_VINCENZO_67 [Mycobacterium phage Vincenzo]|uniref:Uncharacterized protein n=1 Tax=Mycobacterium phage Vincenzo TaxID=1647301 RepID=A0A0F6WDS8_9CAUD|nr:hypothetical protein SEA_VINCENZO_67 [Mycobacterium phage Vincenzo]AKF14329.1 hypothetical protein SEA_VINCENZO_67 [Mycobacterium phage Vincenzo]